MKNEDGTDRLLSEKEIINKARERFGLGAVKFEELLRDCTEIKTMPIQITGEEKTECRLKITRFRFSL